MDAPAGRTRGRSFEDQAKTVQSCMETHAATLYRRCQKSARRYQGEVMRLLEMRNAHHNDKRHANDTPLSFAKRVYDDLVANPVPRTRTRATARHGEREGEGEGKRPRTASDREPRAGTSSGKRPCTRPDHNGQLKNALAVVVHHWPLFVEHLQRSGS